MYKLYLYILHSLLIVFALSHSSHVASEVYKWVDENGNVVYGDKPQNSNAEKVKIKKTPPKDANYEERLQKQDKLLGVMQEEREDKTVQREKEKQEQQQKKAECQRLRQELASMRDASALYEETDDPNNPNILSDKQRKLEEQKYQDYIDDNC